MPASKAQEAGFAESDTDSVASSFVNIRRASPTPSETTTGLREEPAHPPAYSSLTPESAKDASWTNQDLRAASTDSLINNPPEQNDKRLMLLVYVHGFLGNETSFQSFPAHVHNLLSALMSESHIVHTKIYPRYRTKKHLHHATQGLSQWLAPHEGPKTDTVLLGHSLGGFLAANLALLRDDRGEQIRHRLLGTISFDSPFVGMHPGVVKSGIQSLFRPAPSSPASPQPGDVPHPDTFTQTSSVDPYFNPSFANDNHLPIRTGWSNALHFVNKHSKHLITATTRTMNAHLEFGSELADGQALKRRYEMIKALDSEEDAVRGRVVEGRSHPKRTRFVNYYTACSGRPKVPKEASPASLEDDLQDRALDSTISPIRAEGRAAKSLSTEEDGRTLSTGGPTLVEQETHSSDSRSTADLARIETSLTPSSPTLATSPATTTPVLQPTSTTLGIPRPASPAPSYATLPSYTTEPAALALTPAPSYPASARAPSIFSPSGTSTSPRPSVSSFSSDSTASPSDNLQQPVHPGTPPVPSQYPDGAAYAVAFKTYLHDTKQYAQDLKKYHKSVAHQRRSMSLQKVEQEKAKKAAEEEERMLELQMREEERRRIEEAPTEEARQVEIEAMKERRIREELLKRDRIKAEMEQKRRQDRLDTEMSKAERKEAHKTLKRERKATKDALKEQHKLARDSLKEEHKLTKGARKASRKSQPSSPSTCSAQRVLDDDHQATNDPDSYDNAIELQPSPSTPAEPVNQLDQMSTSTTQASRSTKNETRPKDKKFCRLPKDGYHRPDPSWQRVFLEDVDEVGAHCGLFFPQGATGAEAVEGQAWGERYAWLVADVAERIEGWAHDEMTARLVSGLEAL